MIIMTATHAEKLFVRSVSMPNHADGIVGREAEHAWAGIAHSDRDTPDLTVEAGDEGATTELFRAG